MNGPCCFRGIEHRETKICWSVFKSGFSISRNFSLITVQFEKKRRRYILIRFFFSKRSELDNKIYKWTIRLEKACYFDFYFFTIFSDCLEAAPDLNNSKSLITRTFIIPFFLFIIYIYMYAFVPQNVVPKKTPNTALKTFVYLDRLESGQIWRFNAYIYIYKCTSCICRIVPT